MKTMLALRDSKPTAYLVFSRTPNKPSAVESGGNPEALETLLHHALNSLTADERIDFRENDAAAALAVICQRIMPKRRRCYPL